MEKKAPLLKLKRMRTSQKITQKRMAERMQCTPQFYSEIERGINVLSYQNALIIAEFLGTTTDELFKEVYDHLFEMDQQERWNNIHGKKF